MEVSSNNWRLGSCYPASNVTHMQSRLLYHVQIRPTRIGEHKRAVAKPLEHQLFDLLLSSGWPHKSSWIRIPCLQWQAIKQWCSKRSDHQDGCAQNYNLQHPYNTWSSMAKQQTAPYKHEPGLNACVCFSGVPADQPEDSNEHCVILHT